MQVVWAWRLVRHSRPLYLVWVEYFLQLLMTLVAFVTLLAVYTAPWAWKAFPSWIIGCWRSCSYSTASGEVFAWPLSGLSFIYCQWVRVVHHTIFLLFLERTFAFHVPFAIFLYSYSHGWYLFSNILGHCECNLNTKVHFLNLQAMKVLVGLCR